MSPFLCSQPPESGFAANSKVLASLGGSKISLRQKGNISVGKYFGQMSPTSHGSGFKGPSITFMEILTGLCRPAGDGTVLQTSCPTELLHPHPPRYKKHPEVPGDPGC